MSLFKHISINKTENKKTDKISLSSEIPKEMDIFYRTIDAFIPEGKTIDDLTEKEIELIKNKYRFDPMRPGIYQGISGVKNMI